MQPCGTIGVFPLHRSSSLSCMDAYLFVDNGGYLYMIDRRALIAAWLNVSREHKVVL